MRYLAAVLLLICICGCKKEKIEYSSKYDHNTWVVYNEVSYHNGKRCYPWGNKNEHAIIDILDKKYDLVAYKIKENTIFIELPLNYNLSKMLPYIVNEIEINLPKGCPIKIEVQTIQNALDKIDNKLVANQQACLTEKAKLSEIYLRNK